MLKDPTKKEIIEMLVRLARGDARPPGEWFGRAADVLGRGSK